MTTKAWVGVDVACAKGKHLPIVVCVKEQGRLIPLALRDLEHLSPPRGMGNALVINADETSQFSLHAVQYILDITKYFDLKIERIALDAPSSYTKAGSTLYSAASMPVIFDRIAQAQTPNTASSDS